MPEGSNRLESSSLVTTAWVARHHAHASVRLVEVSEESHAYAQGHIAGAVRWDKRVDLQRDSYRDIPTTREWESLLRRSGITPDTLVVLYGDGANRFAAFAYWLLVFFEHERASLLDGGRDRWIAEGRPLTPVVDTPVPSSYVVQRTRARTRALRDDIARAIVTGSAVLLDVRTPEELAASGKESGAGHIPGARHLPWNALIDETGRYKAPGELRRIVEAVGVSPDRPVISYCQAGETSAHTWFALSALLGFAGSRNYDGGWTEWCSLIGAPVEYTWESRAAT